MSLRKYVFRDDRGEGKFETRFMLDEENMPICFDTFMDWVLAMIEPQYRNMAWKLVRVEDIEEDVME